MIQQQPKFKLMRLSITMITTLMLIFSLNSISYAIGFGKINIYSYLNEPLSAEIELLGTEYIDPSLLRAELASEKYFTKAGITRSFFVTKLSFDVVNYKNKTYIYIASTTPIKQPFLELLVQLTWPDGNIIKAYTILLDPAPINNTEQEQRPVPYSLQAYRENMLHNFNTPLNSSNFTLDAIDADTEQPEQPEQPEQQGEYLEKLVTEEIEETEKIKEIKEIKEIRKEEIPEEITIADNKKIDQKPQLLIQEQPQPQIQKSTNWKKTILQTAIILAIIAAILLIKINKQKNQSPSQDKAQNKTQDKAKIIKTNKTIDPIETNLSAPIILESLEPIDLKEDLKEDLFDINQLEQFDDLDLNISEKTLKNSSLDNSLENILPDDVAQSFSILDNLEASEDEIKIKLKLAKQYLDANDKKSAKSLLQEIIKHAKGKHKTEAESLISNLD